MITLDMGGYLLLPDLLDAAALAGCARRCRTSWTGRHRRPHLTGRAAHRAARGIGGGPQRAPVALRHAQPVGRAPRRPAGRPAAGATEQEAFELLLAREFSDPEYFAVHHLTVAAYRLQHPDGASDHALAVLLSAMRAAVDGGLDGPDLRRHVAWAARRLPEHPPGPVPRPTGRAATRATDVARARDAAEHCVLVRRWAAQVCEVWRPVAVEPA